MYDGLFTLAGRLLRAALALALSILLARALGPHGRGLFALPVAYVGIVVAVFTGVTSATSYFLLNRNAGGAVLRPALIVTLIFCAIGTIPVAIFAEIGKNAWAILPATLSMVVSASQTIVLGYVAGIKRVRWQTTLSLANTVVQLVATALIFIFFPRTATVAIIVWLGSGFLVSAVAIAAVIAHARRLPGQQISLSEFAGFSLRIGAVSVVTLLNYRADLYIVALLGTPTMLGQYAVAVSAAESVLTVTQVAAIATSPHIGALEENAAAMLTARCVRSTLLISLVFCGALFVLAPPIVNLLYGAPYMPLVPALRVLLVGVLFLSIASPISSFFTLKLGKPEFSLIAVSVSAAICIAVTWVLVPRIGILGAAIGTAVSYALGQVVAIGIFVRMSRLSPMSLLLIRRDDVTLYTQFAASVVRDGYRKLRHVG